MPFSILASNDGLGSGRFNPYKWFGHHNAHPTNRDTNVVLTNTVNAGASATATNHNEDNDIILNTAINYDDNNTPNNSFLNTKHHGNV